MRKATFVGKSYSYEDNWRVTYLEYEYRGRRYFVVDRGWKASAYDESLYCQHQNEQDRIDRIIEEENKPKQPVSYEDTAEYGFELFWEYVES